MARAVKGNRLRKMPRGVAQSKVEAALRRHLGIPQTRDRRYNSASLLEPSNPREPFYF